MKKIFDFSFALIFICCTITVTAQSPRMTVVEEATQASCPPCATLNPILQELLNQNLDKTVFIAYQVDWPGLDPMNLDNPEEVRSRIEYYGMTQAPSIVIQGDSGPGPISSLDQNLIDQTFSETAEFDIQLSGAINNDELTINGEVKANTAVSGNLKLHLLILEKLIVNEDLEFLGSNGESEFHHVFKKYIHGPDGLSLANDWQTNDSYTISETFDLNELNIYNKGELEVIAMVQNGDNKYIYQAALEDELDISVDFNNNVVAKSIKGLPRATCTGMQEVLPVVKLENYGNDPLTSATIEYNVNGGTPAIYEWSGMLTTFKKEEIELPKIAYEAEDINNVFVTISNPNGVTDEDNSNNNLTSDKIIAPLNQELVVIEIQADAFGPETYWEIRNEAGEMVTFGGNPNVGLTNFNMGTGPAPAHPDMYTNGSLNIETFIIEANECYTFHMTDYSENGLSASAGIPPYYKVSNIFGDTLVYGTTEAFKEIIRHFQGDLGSSVDDQSLANKVQLYPNPVQSKVNLEITLRQPAAASVQLFNAIGQQVYTKDLGNISIGETIEQFDLSGLVNGIYMLNIKLNEEIVTRKIVVNN